jgi:hypothetical protein
LTEPAARPVTLCCTNDRLMKCISRFPGTDIGW